MLHNLIYRNTWIIDFNTNNGENFLKDATILMYLKKSAVNFVCSYNFKIENRSL